MKNEIERTLKKLSDHPPIFIAAYALCAVGSLMAIIVIIS